MMIGIILLRSPFYLPRRAQHPLTVSSTFRAFDHIWAGGAFVDYVGRRDLSWQTPQGSVATKYARVTAPFITTWAYQRNPGRGDLTLEILVPGGCRILRLSSLW
jgi:hypothetical protein